MVNLRPLRTDTTCETSYCLRASVDRERRLFPRVFVVAAVAFQEVRRFVGAPGDPALGKR